MSFDATRGKRVSPVKMVGETVGSYRITHELGKGGMGVVYAAEHVVLGSKAAVKVLLPKLSSDSGIVARFFNEARAATHIKHPGIVAVFDFGKHEASGSAYLIMELLEGEALSTRRKRVGRLPLRQSLVLVRQVARTLEPVHASGIIHRDLKPHNLFIVADPEVESGERVKVLDFGIAKLMGDLAPADNATGDGSVLGTPKYMAPEQCRGAAGVDARSDVYSLGCILFELVCGAPPFSGESAAEVISKQLYVEAPSPANFALGLPPEVERLIIQCLQKNAQVRPASMSELAWRIERLLDTISETDTERVPVSIAQERLEDTQTATATPSPAPSKPLELMQTTTLGDQAGEGKMVRARRAVLVRTARYVAFALIVALLLGSLFVATRNSTDESRRETAMPRDQHPILVEQGHTDATRDASLVDPGSQEAHVRSEVGCSISCEPTGAAVFRVSDGAWMGQCPLSWKMPLTKGSIELELRLKGYKEKRIKLDTSADATITVALEPQRVPANTSIPAPTTSGHDAASQPESLRIGDGIIDPFEGAVPTRQ